MLLFQHNNIKAVEWTGIRRELANAFKKVDEELARNGDETFVGQSSKMQIVQTGIFASALKIVEFWEPKYLDEVAEHKHDPSLTHGLSKNAYFSAKNAQIQHGLEPLLWTHGHRDSAQRQPCTCESCAFNPFSLEGNPCSQAKGCAWLPRTYSADWSQKAHVFGRKS